MESHSQERLNNTGRQGSNQSDASIIPFPFMTWNLQIGKNSQTWLDHKQWLTCNGSCSDQAQRNEEFKRIIEKNRVIFLQEVPTKTRVTELCKERFHCIEGDTSGSEFVFLTLIDKELCGDKEELEVKMIKSKKHILAQKINSKEASHCNSFTFFNVHLVGQNEDRSEQIEVLNKALKLVGSTILLGGDFNFPDYVFDFCKADLSGYGAQQTANIGKLKKDIWPVLHDINLFVPDYSYGYCKNGPYCRTLPSLYIKDLLGVSNNLPGKFECRTEIKADHCLHTEAGGMNKQWITAGIHYPVCATPIKS